MVSVQSYCPSNARLSSVTLAAPSAVFNRTSGLVGSWDHNAADDYIDANGTDWREVYPNNDVQASYSFAQTWKVDPSASLFVAAGQLNLLPCLTVSACSVAAANLTTNSSVNSAAVYNVSLFNMAPVTVPLPALWPNAALQSQATTACMSARGTTNASDVVYQSCLVDVYTSGNASIAKGLADQQSSVVALAIAPPSLLLVSTSNVTLSVLIDASTLNSTGLCAVLIVSANLSAMFTRACVLTVQYAPSVPITSL